MTWRGFSAAPRTPVRLVSRAAALTPPRVAALKVARQGKGFLPP